MGMTYGTKMSPQTAELVRMADEVIMAWSKVAVPGAYFVSSPANVPIYLPTNIGLSGRFPAY